MIKPKRILFLSAPFGHGHAKAAQAVIKAIKKRDSEVDTRLVDVFEDYPDFFGGALTKAYLRFVAKVPRLYGTLYDMQNQYGKYFSTRSFMHMAGAYKMLKLVRKIQPSAIVCSHFLPAGILDYLIQKQHINVPVYGIITDYSLHYWWVFEHIRKYFVGCDEMVASFAHYDIDANHVQVTGIPSSLDLSKLNARTEILNKLNLRNDLPIIAAMGGGTGMIPLVEIAEALDKSTVPFQMVMMAGTNLKMYRKLVEYKKHARKPLRIYSYIDFVNDVMAVSDMIISKPGGLTTAETLSIGLPMIVYNPIPGHETDNANFLTSNNAAIVAPNINELINIVEGLLTCPKTLQQLHLNVMNLGRPDAAAAIADELLKFE
ncbi:MAG: glycosyltransferase [Negativicutes bacterium]